MGFSLLVDSIILHPKGKRPRHRGFVRPRPKSKCRGTSCLSPISKPPVQLHPLCLPDLFESAPSCAAHRRSFVLNCLCRSSANSLPHYFVQAHPCKGRLTFLFARYVSAFTHMSREPRTLAAKSIDRISITVLYPVKDLP